MEDEPPNDTPEDWGLLVIVSSLSWAFEHAKMTWAILKVTRDLQGHIGDVPLKTMWCQGMNWA